jgi:hypothetical protein
MLFGMRKLVVIGVALVALAAWAGISIDTGTLVTFTDCSSSGSAAQTLQGTYELSVTDEDTWICQSNTASTCASGGWRLPVGAVIEMQFGNLLNSRSVSCRSAASTGDLNFVRAN